METTVLVVLIQILVKSDGLAKLPQQSICKYLLTHLQICPLPGHLATLSGQKP